MTVLDTGHRLGRQIERGRIGARGMRKTSRWMVSCGGLLDGLRERIPLGFEPLDAFVALSTPEYSGEPSIKCTRQRVRGRRAP
jgi:hypothetical protein